MKTQLFLLIFIIILLFSKVSFAQDTPRAKSFIEISGGISNPTGNFASSALTNNIQSTYNSTDGYAQLGSHFAINGAWYLTPNFGVGGTLSTSSYSVNANALANEIINSFDCDSATASARNYNTISVLVGPYYAIRLGHLTIEARVLAGITNTTTPDFIMQAINLAGGSDPESISTFVQKSGTATALGLDAGIGIKFALAKHLGLVLRTDYFYSKPKLSFDNVGRQNNAGRLVTSYNQPIAGVNSTFGVCYFF